jgi:hypothetical protein
VEVQAVVIVQLLRADLEQQIQEAVAVVEAVAFFKEVTEVLGLLFFVIQPAVDSYPLD